MYCNFVVIKKNLFTKKFLNKHLSGRAVGRYEHPGVPVLFGGHNLPPLVEIGLTDLPKSPRDDRPER
jgi:hypothetical protein